MELTRLLHCGTATFNIDFLGCQYHRGMEEGGDWNDCSERIKVADLYSSSHTKIHLWLPCAGKYGMSHSMIKETQTCVWSWGWGEGEGGMNWEIRFDINMLLCVTYIAGGNLLCSRGSSA